MSLLITPAYTTGSVPGFAGATGLLQTIVAYVTGAPGTPGRDWTVEMNRDITDNSGGTIVTSPQLKEVILSNTGISGLETIIVAMREYQYPSTSEWGIELNGHIVVPSGWNADAAATHGKTGWDTDRKHWKDLPHVQAADQQMDYWIYSTKEFIGFCVRVGTSYFQGYLGNGARLGTPSEYPNPLYIAGSEVGNISYQAGGNGPVRPKDNTYFFVDPNGAFRSGTDCEVLPMQLAPAYTDNVQVDLAPNGAVLLSPVYVTTTQILAFQLWNTFAVRVMAPQPENYYDDINGLRFRIWPQGKNDYNYDFMAFYEIDAGALTTTTV